jgi:HK97 family phage portal protein
MRQPRPTGFTGMVWRVRAAFAALGGQALPPWDDYWFSRPGLGSAAGMAVSPETAMRLSAVYSCVRVISESLASCPLVIYKRLPGGGRERAINHPLFKVLHDKPNPWQTSLEFIEMMQAHLELRGNAFARIVEGRDRAIDQLVPLHPDLVEVQRLPSGRLKYAVRSRYQAEVEYFLQEEIFHLRGLSSDGLVGLSPVALQRETIGTALGMQDYSGRFFSNNATPSGVLIHPQKFKNDAARDKFGESWKAAHTKENQHSVAVLEDGMEYKSIAVSNKDAQFLEAIQAKDVQICGMHRVPPHKIGILDRATHSNIEHQGIEFVTDCVRPRAARWQQRINTDLIDPLSEALGNEEFFAEFVVDGLLLGDRKSRYDAYKVGIDSGFLCPNDACRFENLNPIPDEKGGNDYRRPINYVVAGQEPPAAPGLPAPADNKNSDGDTPSSDVPDSTDASEQRLHLFADGLAGRTVRKEVAALRKMLAKSPDTFDQAAKEFYGEHEKLVSETMGISSAAARNYLADHWKLFFNIPDAADKACVIDWIEDNGSDELARVALKGSRQTAIVTTGGK